MEGEGQRTRIVVANLRADINHLSDCKNRIGRVYSTLSHGCYDALGHPQFSKSTNQHNSRMHSIPRSVLGSNRESELWGFL